MPDLHTIMSKVCVMPRRDWQVEQHADPILGWIIHWLEAGNERPASDISSGEPPEVKLLLQQWNTLVLRRGLLCRRFTDLNTGKAFLQRVVPQPRRLELFMALHGRPEGGHLGYDRVYSLIRERYYWCGMSEDVRHWLRACVVCQRVKSYHRRGRYPLAQEQSGAPLERCAMDVSGPWPTTTRGNTYLLVLQDYYSKWLEVWPIPNHKAPTVASKLVEFMSRYGCIHKLHSDQGPEFESHLMTALCKAWDIRKTRTTPYSPWSDGMVERANRTIKQILTCYVAENAEDWDQRTWAVMMAYNSTPHASTGMTPFRLMHSRCEDPELPTDLLYGREPTDVAHVACPVKYVEGQRLVAQQISARVAQTLRQSAVLQKRDHARGGLRLVEYHVNDEVWWYYPPHANRKLGVPWLGPFTVVGMNKPGNTVKICGLGRLQWVHASSLKHVLRARNGDLVNSPYRLPRAT